MDAVHFPGVSARLVIALLGVLGPSAPHSISPTVSSGTPLLHGIVPISSPSLGARRRAMIYLPPGYGAFANGFRRYPVIYLLSGSPGSQRDWFTHGRVNEIADTLINSGKAAPLILVSPDGNGDALRDTQFVDRADGRKRVEQFLTRDVIAYVDSHYRTIPSARGGGLVGYSAGAFGALNVGLNHPDLYTLLAGFCGNYTARPQEVSDPALNHRLSANPAFTATQLPHALLPHIFLFESTVDGYYTGTTRQFDAELVRLGITHVTHLYTPRNARERSQWRHSWLFVRRAFADNLPQIAGAFAAERLLL